MKTMRRRGIAARVAAPARASMASSRGRAMATPVLRRNVRRKRVMGSPRVLRREGRSYRRAGRSFADGPSACRFALRGYLNSLSVERHSRMRSRILFALKQLALHDFVNQRLHAIILLA